MFERVGYVASLLDRVESKAFRLINSSSLTDCLQPLYHLRNVASLAIFYFYCYSHANCSSDLTNCMSPLPWSRCTTLFSFFLPHSFLLLSNARVKQYSQSIIPLSVNSGTPYLFLYSHLHMIWIQDWGFNTLILWLWAWSLVLLLVH